MTWIKVFTTTGLVALALSSQVRAEPKLPAIPKGDIAIDLRAIATGMAAPDYAISPPGGPEGGERCSAFGKAISAAWASS